MEKTTIEQIKNAMHVAHKKGFSEINLSQSNVFGDANTARLQESNMSLTPEEYDRIVAASRGLYQHVVKQYLANPYLREVKLHFVEFGTSFIVIGNDRTECSGKVDYYNYKIGMTETMKEYKY